MLLQVRFGTQAMGGVRGDTDDTWYVKPQRLVSGHSRCQRCSDDQIPLLTGGSQQPYRRTWELGKEARPPRPVSHQCLKESVWSMWQSWLTWDCTETELFFFFQKRLSTNGEGFFLLGQSAPRFLDPTSRQPYTCRGKALALPLRNETSRQMEDRALQTPQQDALGWAINYSLWGQKQGSLGRGASCIPHGLSWIPGSYKAWARTQTFPIISTYVHMNGRMHRIHSLKSTPRHTTSTTHSTLRTHRPS